MAIPDLSIRRPQDEIMDRPDLDPDQLIAALKGIGRLNRLSRADAVLWPPIHNAVKTANPDQPLRILDIAAGAGDIARRLLRRAQKMRLPLEIDVCDANNVAVALATKDAKRAQLEKVTHAFQCDILREPLPADYDIIMGSQFLHHLTNSEALIVLQKMRNAARHSILLTDVLRTRLGYRLAYWAPRLFSRCTVIHIDGPLSIRAAFSLTEFQQLAKDADMHNATLQTHWPQRVLLQWAPPTEL